VLALASATKKKRQNLLIKPLASFYVRGFEAVELVIFCRLIRLSQVNAIPKRHRTFAYESLVHAPSIAALVTWAGFHRTAFDLQPAHYVRHFDPYVRTICSCV
jgi:hypothetical protein